MNARTKGALTGAAALLATGCVLPLDIHIDTDDVHLVGSGHVVSEARVTAPFHSISARGAVVVFVEQTGRERVVVSAEDNLIDHVETDVRSGVLHIGFHSGVSISTHREVVVEIEAVELAEITGSGAVRIEANLGWQPELWVSLSGASSLTTTGGAELHDIDLSGASHYDALDFEADLVRIVASGASRAWVWARDRLDAVASGASQVLFVGDPVVTASVSGGAFVRPY